MVQNAYQGQNQIFHMMLHIQKAHQETKVDNISLFTCYHTQWGYIRKGMITAVEDAKLLKLNLSMKSTYENHQNKRLKIIHILTLDKTLIQQQLYLHSVFMKQFSS